MYAMLITKCGCTKKIKVSYAMPTLTIPFKKECPMMEVENCNILKIHRRDFKLQPDTSNNNLLIYKEI